MLLAAPPVTWLELFLLYARHGGNEEEAKLNEKNPLRKLEQMRTQVAEFKQLTRIAKHAGCEEEEWPFRTADEGRQSAMHGMPVVNDDDVEAIVNAIM